MIKKNRIKLLFAVLFSVVICALFVFMNTDNSEFRSDLEPIVERFGNSVEINSCFWKAAPITSNRIGPSSYWIKGFIVLTKADFDRIVNDYSMKKTQITFDDNINPNITGYNNFNWYYSDKLAHELKGGNFIGDVYLDITNGIVFFDLENL